jgi:hypothetical protein
MSSYANIYKLLIITVISLKLLYIGVVVVSKIGIYAKWSTQTNLYLNNLKDSMLSVSEIFMYMVLIAIFYPRNNSSDIKINKEEQLILFILGILGILHTNWELVQGFTTDLYNVSITI